MRRGNGHPLGSGDGPRFREGFRWESDREGGDGGSAPPEVGVPGEVLRSLPGREVRLYRREDGTALVLKTFWPRRPIDVFRHLLFPSPARRERDRLRRARDRGVPAPAPAALGERRRFGVLRESVLAMSYVEGLRADRMFEGTAPGEAVRNRFLEAFASFLRTLVDRGLRFRDLHPGNFLVRREGGAFSFTAVDFGAVSFGGTARGGATDEVLLRMDLYLLGRASTAERVRFMKAFLSPGASRDQRRATASRLSGRVEREARRLWRKAGRRCMGENKYFGRFRSGGFRGRCRRGAPRPWSGSDPMEPFGRAEAERLKDSAGALSVLFEGEGGRLYGKYYRPASWGDILKAVFRPSKALRAWKRSCMLEAFGLPVPRAIAAGSRRVAGMPLGSVFFAEGVEDGICLDRFLHQRRGSREAGEAVRAVGRMVGLLHRRGFSHRDLKAGNILVRAGAPGEVFLTDLDGLTGPRRLTARRRRKDLARFLRSAREDCGFGEREFGWFREAVDRAQVR